MLKGGDSFANWLLQDWGGEAGGCGEEVACGGEQGVSQYGRYYLLSIVYDCGKT